MGKPACQRSSTAGTPSLLSFPRSNDTVHKVVPDELTTTFFRVARHIVVHLSFAIQVHVPTIASRLSLIHIQLLCVSRDEQIFTQEMMDIPFYLRLYVTVSRCSDMLRYVPKHMVAADTKLLPTTIYNCQQTTPKPPAIVAPEKQNYEASLKQKRNPDFANTVGAVNDNDPAEKAKEIEGHANK